jgi:hypothetical protein
MTASNHCPFTQKTLASRGPSTHEAALISLGFQPGNNAVAAPKLNYVSADKVLHLSDCFCIVRAHQRRRASDMAVMPYKVRPVLRHR